MDSAFPVPSSALAWLPQLLQTNDSAFPSGSYAHSFGLESLVQLGMVTDRDGLAALLKAHLIPMFQNVDLPFVRLAHAVVAAEMTRRNLSESCGAAANRSPRREPWVSDQQIKAPVGATEADQLSAAPAGAHSLPDQTHGSRRGLRSAAPPALEPSDSAMSDISDEAVDPTVVRLLALDELCTALKGSAELRQAGSRIGSQRLAMLLQLTPSPLLTALDKQRAEGRFQAQAPVMHGVQTALIGTPLEAALLGYFYQSLAAILSAAMKLIRFGQIAAQTLLTECLGLAPAVIAASRDVAQDDIGWFSPSLDIASARHETAYTRIFIS